jgi:hypothetical protein
MQANKERRSDVAGMIASNLHARSAVRNVEWNRGVMTLDIDVLGERKIT